jgi:hypothetical protein
VVNHERALNLPFSLRWASFATALRLRAGESSASARILAATSPTGHRHMTGLQIGGIIDVRRPPLAPVGGDARLGGFFRPDGWPIVLNDISSNQLWSIACCRRICRGFLVHRNQARFDCLLRSTKTFRRKERPVLIGARIAPGGCSFHCCAANRRNIRRCFDGARTAAKLGIRDQRNSHYRDECNSPDDVVSAQAQ